MGIVATQSFKNIISTYLGFFIGAINTLFLYTNFMSDQYYGMVGFMLSLASVIMPLMAFGVPNTLIKFYSSFKNRMSLHSFLTLMLFLPIVFIVPIVIFTYVAHDAIAQFLAERNTIIKFYLWHTIIIAIALAYFEVFYAWAKVQMQTVFGNFMKEVFPRIGAMLLLFSLYLKWLSLTQFLWGLVLIYVARMLVMCLYAFSITLPRFYFKKVNHAGRILKYAFLIILAGSIATTLLDIDKVMLGKYLPDLKYIAYYNVAVFITAVIAVPQRAMHQILMPLSAKFLNTKDFSALGELYKRSSLNLFIVGGLVFLLIVLNINQLYYLIDPEYRVGLFVVLLISVAKLYDALLGSNNAILFNSDYYRIVLILGVFLVLIMVVLNRILIPVYGINGAAIATFISISLYNSGKLYVVYKKLKVVPFTTDTLRTGLLLIGVVLLFYFWDFPFHPVLNIGLKSTLVVLIYTGVVYFFNFSQDITDIVNKVLKLK